MIHIRPATEDDLPEIAAIYGHAVTYGTASYELKPPGIDEMRTRFLALVEEDFPYLVATDEQTGSVLGYAYAGPYRTRPAYRYVVEDSVYVAPDAKGKGVGRRLLDRLVIEITERGFHQVIAVIGDGERSTASIRMHEAAGFRHSGRLEGSGYKHGRWLDTVLMQMPVNGGRDEDPVGVSGRSR